MEYIHRVISIELSEQIDNMIKKINEFFGIKVSGVQASKIISWKAKNYNLNLTSQRLIDILGRDNAKGIKK